MNARMQRIRILTADASALGGQLEEMLTAHAPDVIALTGIGPARASKIAGSRSMRAATQAWSGEDDVGLALLWKAGLAVGSMDRFDFGHMREPCGALRITFSLDGRTAGLYCALLMSERSGVAGQEAHLAELIDSARQPALVACEGCAAQAGELWSRCADAWTIAERRVVSLPASADAGLAAQRAFGIAGGTTTVDLRSHAGPVWHCSEEFSVLESRSIAVASAPDRPVRTAVVSLHAGAAAENEAIAL
jgi:hypothetical protein